MSVLQDANGLLAKQVPQTKLSRYSLKGLNKHATLMCLIVLGFVKVLSKKLWAKHAFLFVSNRKGGR